MVSTGIAAGKGHAIWFANLGGDNIGRIATTGEISSFNAPSIDHPTRVAAGPAGGIWFTNNGNDSIGWIETLGPPMVGPAN